MSKTWLKAIKSNCRKIAGTDIHAKINRKQAQLLKEYSIQLFWDIAGPHKYYMFKEIPKNMRYGGHRNTCYHINQIIH